MLWAPGAGLCQQCLMLGGNGVLGEQRSQRGSEGGGARVCTDLLLCSD